MYRIDYRMLLERVLVWIGEFAPLLLLDDVFLEGLLYLVCREVTAAVREVRERQHRRVREAKPC